MANRKLMRFVVVLAMLGLSAGGSFATEMILDGDFEAGPNNRVAFPGTWSVWTGNGSSGRYYHDGQMHSGTKSFATWGPSYAWQCVSVVGGNEYSLSAWVRPYSDPWPTGVGTTIEMIWFEAESATMADYANRISNQIVVTYVPQTSEWNTWNQISGSIAAPTNAHCAIVKFGDKTGSGWSAAFFDDVSMTPEPVTMSLLGFGAVLTLVRRKKTG